MQKLWLIAKHEYLNSLRDKVFLIVTFGAPALIFVLIVVGSAFFDRSSGEGVIGYVDHSGLLSQTQAEATDADVQVRAYHDLDTGRAAVEAGDIQALFVLSEDYLASRQGDVYYLEKRPSEDAWEAWNRLVRDSLLATEPEEVRQRVEGGANLVIRSADGRSKFSSDAGGTVILAIFLAIFFMFATMMAGSSLLQAVVAEKEDRTVEVMVSSVTPGQLVGGKAAGLIAAAITQLFVWVIAIAIIVTVDWPMIGAMPHAEIPWQLIAAAALYFLPSFVLVGGAVIAVGSAVGDSQQAQTITGALSMFFIMPLMMMPIIFTNPSSPVLTFMTLFPATSFLTIMIRSAITAIPTWELIVSWLLLAASAGASIWLAAKVFRLGMLLHGKSLDLRLAFRKGTDVAPVSHD